MTCEVAYCHLARGGGRDSRQTVQHAAKRTSVVVTRSADPVLEDLGTRELQRDSNNQTQGPGKRAYWSGVCIENNPEYDGHTVAWATVNNNNH